MRLLVAAGKRSRCYLPISSASFGSGACGCGAPAAPKPNFNINTLGRSLPSQIGSLGRRPQAATLPCAQPVRIEIPIGFAIVGRARHVPMADQMRIGIPNWRPASDMDNAIAIALEDRVRFVCGVNFYQRPFRASPIWKRGDRSRSRDHNMTSGQSEESLDVGFVFGSRIALPGKARRHDL